MVLIGMGVIRIGGYPELFHAFLGIIETVYHRRGNEVVGVAVYKEHRVGTTAYLREG